MAAAARFKKRLSQHLRCESKEENEKKKKIESGARSKRFIQYLKALFQVELVSESGVAFPHGALLQVLLLTQLVLKLLKFAVKPVT